MGVLGDRAHHVDHVDDLEAPLFRRFDGFLAGDHHHRHAPELGIGCGGHEIRGPRPERRKAHPRVAGQPAVGRRHEASGLLVSGEDQPNLAEAGQRVDESQILLARNPEDVFDAFLLERFDEQFRCIHWILSRSQLLKANYSASSMTRLVS